MNNDIDSSNGSNSELPIDMQKTLAHMENFRNMNEAVMQHFPNLDIKELIICSVIVSAHHDVLDGRSNYVVPVTIDNYPIFRNEKEVEDKIEELVHKGVVMRELIGGSVYFTLKDNIQNEIVYQERRKFEMAIEQICEKGPHLKIVKRYYIENLNGVRRIVVW